MTGQPIQQKIQEQQIQTLWDFLFALPSSMEGQIMIALLLSGFLGVFLHYMHKWLTDEITGNLFTYLFVSHPKRTALSLMGYVVWMSGLVGTGLFVTPSGDFVGWGIVLIMGLSNGYSVDSLANKGNRQEWTPEKRKEAQGASDSKGS